MAKAPPAPEDPSQGWEAVAAAFIAHRERTRIGEATLSRWAATLTPGATVLDLGCGAGAPVSVRLREAGHSVYGIDASPTLLAAYRERLPGAPAACEAVEHSGFFGCRFEAVVAIGLLFLLGADAQRALIARVGAVLKPGGRFLFTAPAQACHWQDLMTGRVSVSLGAAAYGTLLADDGLRLVGQPVDEGQNHYYDAVRDADRAGAAETPGTLGNRRPGLRLPPARR